MLHWNLKNYKRKLSNAKKLMKAKNTKMKRYKIGNPHYGNNRSYNYAYNKISISS